jgi:hypothetical protein
VRERLRVPRETAQEREHLVDIRRHLGHERVLGVTRIVKKLRKLPPQPQDAVDHRRVVPIGIHAQIGRAGRVRAMHRRAQRVVVCVLHHRQIARRPQRELPALLPLGRGVRLRLGDDAGRNAGELGHRGDVERPRIGRIEHVVRKLRQKCGQLLPHFLQPCLFSPGQLGAGEPEIAQFIFDQFLLGRVKARERR